MPECAFQIVVKPASVTEFPFRPDAVCVQREVYFPHLCVETRKRAIDKMSIFQKMGNGREERKSSERSHDAFPDGDTKIPGNDFMDF